MTRGLGSIAIPVAAHRMIANTYPGAARFDADTWTEKPIGHQHRKQIVEQIRALRGSSSEPIYADRAEVLSRVFLQGTLLPLLDRE
ncbi:MAG: hypothetical protein ACOYM3_27705 [Terrimicrobiaceae bacterium]